MKQLWDEIQTSFNLDANVNARLSHFQIQFHAFPYPILITSAFSHYVDMVYVRIEGKQTEKVVAVQVVLCLFTLGLGMCMNYLQRLAKQFWQTSVKVSKGEAISGTWLQLFDYLADLITI